MEAPARLNRPCFLDLWGHRLGPWVSWGTRWLRDHLSTLMTAMGSTPDPRNNNSSAPSFIHSGTVWSGYSMLRMGWGWKHRGDEIGISRVQVHISVSGQPLPPPSPSPVLLPSHSGLHSASHLSLTTAPVFVFWYNRGSSLPQGRRTESRISGQTYREEACQERGLLSLLRNASSCPCERTCPRTQSGLAIELEVVAPEHAGTGLGWAQGYHHVTPTPGLGKELAVSHHGWEDSQGTWPSRCVQKAGYSLS